MQNVLIIEDEVDICFLLAGILKSIHLNVEYVHSLAAAKKMLDKNAYFMVFLDNHLPDGLGVDFIDDIKSRQLNAKIVIITAYDNADDNQKALDNGADVFLGKPFSIQTIRAVVAEFQKVHS